MELAKILIVEDGDEYTEAFGSYFSKEFEFIQSKSAAEALEMLDKVAGIVAIVLDMRFDRSEKSALVGDRESLDIRFAGDPLRVEQYLVEHQGLFILRHLRDADIHLPVILSYDFTHEMQRFSALSHNDPALFYLVDDADAAQLLSLFRRATQAVSGA